EADRLGQHFDKMLNERGFLGHISDGLKNNIGSPDGWIIDSNLGSDAVGKTMIGVYKARAGLDALKDFKGSSEEFQKLYEERRQKLEDAIRAGASHMERYAKSQEAWADGIADFGSVLLAVGAAGLAPFTGGGSLAALGLGVAGGALGKVAIKGGDALVGGRPYDSWGKGLLDRGNNRVRGGAGRLPPKKATQDNV